MLFFLVFLNKITLGEVLILSFDRSIPGTLKIVNFYTVSILDKFGSCQKFKDLWQLAKNHQTLIWQNYDDVKFEFDDFDCNVKYQYFKLHFDMMYTIFCLSE